MALARYRLESFHTSCMVWAGAELRLSRETFGSMEAVAQRQCDVLWERFEGPDGGPGFGLVRVYRTLPATRLPPDLRTTALGPDYQGPDVKCLTLLGSRGIEPAWNDRRSSEGHRAIAMPDPGFVSAVPMLAELFRSFGVDVARFLAGETLALSHQGEARHFNVFHVESAAGSPHIPAQAGFVEPYGIESVIGFGGLLPDGEIYAVIGFSRARVDAEVARRFSTLTLHCRVPLADFAFGPVFEGESATDGLSSDIRCESLEMVMAEHEIRVFEQALQIEERGREMEAILDAVSEGLAMFDARGRLLGRPSSRMEAWFGPIADGASVAELVRPHSEETAEFFELGFEVVAENFMPASLTLEQLPKRVRVGDWTLEFEFHPVEEAGVLRQVLGVVRDIGPKLQAEQQRREQADMLSAFSRMLEDSSAFDVYTREGDRLCACLQDASASPVEVFRAIHTLKGISALFGLTGVARHAHEVEDRARDRSQLPPRPLREALVATYRGYCARLRALGSRERTHFELSPEEHERLLALSERADPQLRNAIRDLALEPFHRRFERLGRETRALARMLGKGDVTVEIQHGDHRFDPELWAGFWSEISHLIRNSVDHGLEGSDERRAAGKPPMGRVRFSARRTEREMVVEVADDGRGIQWDAVRTKAASRGLDVSSEAALHAALFTDGFSTREAVSVTSGRGVGLAAFRAAVEQLNGHIEVRSRRGKGTRFIVRIPHDPARAAA